MPQHGNGIIPVLLADSVHLFDRPGGPAVKLERLSLTSSPQLTQLWLRVANELSATGFPAFLPKRPAVHDPVPAALRWYGVA